MSREADEIIGLYRRQALAWTRARGDRLVERDWLDRFRGLLPPAGAVLDIGCGSGVPIARYLVDRGLSVTGVDSAPEMIALFEANLPGQRAQVADMRTLDLAERFDGILAWDSFFHLSPSAQRGMFSIFQRHGRTNAALMFTSGPSFGEAIGALEGEPLYHASLDGDEYRDLLADNGFAVAAQVYEDASCGGRSVWLAKHR